MVRGRSFVALLAVASMVATACGDDEPDTASTDVTESTASTETSGAVVGATTTTVAEPTTTAAADTTSAASTTVPPPELAGREFVSTAVTGFELVPGSPIRLTFTADQISAAGGCNQQVSTWSLDGDLLVVAEMASTRMACEPPTLMDQDTWIAALLTSQPTVALDGDTMTLTAGQSSITLAAA